MDLDISVGLSFPSMRFDRVEQPFGGQRRQWIRNPTHMLRHSTGFKLANQGVDTRSLQHYLGHKNIQHTVRYSELSPERFRDFWKD